MICSLFPILPFFLFFLSSCSAYDVDDGDDPLSYNVCCFLLLADMRPPPDPLFFCVFPVSRVEAGDKLPINTIQYAQVEHRVVELYNLRTMTLVRLITVV